MKEVIVEKLQHLVGRSGELEGLLSDPEVISDQNRFRDLAREFSQLEPVVALLRETEQTQTDLLAAREMLEEDDEELKALGKEEIDAAEQRLAEIEQEVQAYLVPKDPHDDNNIYLEIRAGTGGDEAALFAGDLFRMYLRYVDEKKWTLEILSESEGDHGGFKEIICRVLGRGAYSRLKFESGAHRVQRVPETESQGRVHTSACTVAILPEIENAETVEINSADLRIDTFRASGAGGQHVNKTDSAVRLTHIPSGIVVECQDGRSQHKNKAKALSLLQARILDTEQQKIDSAQAEQRRNLVGSGDRSQRIRTYNFPQGRVTDHRINLTLYKLDDILAGNVDQIIDPLASEHQADQLAELDG